jgi:hypothetical protein
MAEEITPAPEHDTTSETPLAILRAIAISKRTGSGRHRIAGATHDVGNEEGGVLARVKVEQMSRLTTYDPRTIVKASVPGADLELTETYRPPVEDTTLIYKIVMTFAKEVLAANAAIEQVREHIAAQT